MHSYGMPQIMPQFILELDNPAKGEGNPPPSEGLGEALTFLPDNALSPPPLAERCFLRNAQIKTIYDRPAPKREIISRYFLIDPALPI
jgi:hypothetical protein